MDRRIPKEHKRFLETAGIDWEIVRRKKHTIVELSHNGRTKRLPITGTASDHRALKNFRSDVRNFIKEKPPP